MSDINDVLPEGIKTVEDAKHWLLVHGYSVDVANEELKNWNPPEADDAPAEEPAPAPEPEVEEEDEEWDEAEEEDEEWDDEEDEDWDEDDSEEDED